MKDRLQFWNEIETPRTTGNSSTHISFITEYCNTNYC